MLFTCKKRYFSIYYVCFERRILMSKNVKELTIKVEGKEWKDAIDAAFDKANKKVKIDGFRPGKAPKEVFLKKYGVEALYMDAAVKTQQRGCKKHAPYCKVDQVLLFGLLHPEYSIHT